MVGEHIIRQTVAALTQGTNRYPFLFVGSGLSRRYLNLPDWAGLLRMTCEKVLDDEYAYARYVAEARSVLGVSSLSTQPVELLPKVASLLEHEVNACLLSSERFAGFRVKYRERLIDGSCSPMKLYMADLLSGLELTDDQNLVHEIDLLRKVGRGKVSGVITTNYDHLCNLLFPEYETYIGEKGMLFRDPTFECETFMIHGSVDEPDSMVLTTEDYAEFELGREYLVAKLLTIFAEYPVIFLGYSIQDENIRGILASVARSAGPEMLEVIRSRMLFVRFGDGGDNPASTIAFNPDGNLLEMTCITTTDFLPIFQGIDSGEKLYTPRVIRALKGNVYRIAESLDPQSKVVVSAFDNALDNLGEDERVIIGFGQLHSDLGQPVRLVDVYRDVVLNDLSLPPTLVVFSYLDDLLKNNSGVVPVFKYLSELGIRSDELDKLPERIRRYVKENHTLDSFRSPTERRNRKSMRNVVCFTHSVSGLIEKYGMDVAYRYLLNLDESEIDVAELGKYLAGLMHDKDGNISTDILETATYKSTYRKCVRVYDFLRYKDGSSPSFDQARRYT